MIEKPIFWDYIITDDDGELKGIKNNAPEEAKEAYKKYLQDREKQKEELFKI